MSDNPIAAGQAVSLKEAEVVVYAKWWSANLFGFEQSVGLEVYASNGQIRMALLYDFNGKIIQWPLAAQDGVQQFIIFPPLKLKTVITGWNQGSESVSFRLVVKIHAFATQIPVNEEIHIVLPDNEQLEALLSLQINSIEEFHSLLSLFSVSSDTYSDDDEQLGAGKKCWSRNNCTGKVVGVRADCHNCKGKSSGKSLGTPGNCQRCK